MKSLKNTMVCFLLLSVLATTSYADENLLKSSDFSKKASWSFYIKNSVNDAGGVVTFIEGKLVVKSTDVAKQNPADIQVYKEIMLEADKRYKLSIKISSESKGILPVAYTLLKAPYSRYAKNIIKILPGDNKEYNCILEVKADENFNDNTRRCIRLLTGTLSGVTLSNITIEEIM